MKSLQSHHSYSLNYRSRRAKLHRLNKARALDPNEYIQLHEHVSNVLQVAAPAVADPGLSANQALDVMQYQHIPNLINSLSDAGAAVMDEVVDKQDDGILAPIVNTLQAILGSIQSVLEKANVPYSYGWSIIILTALTRLALFPVLKTQVESSLAMQSLKPRIDNIKERYTSKKDADKIQRETQLLYKEAGVNPSAGCVPALVSLPIFLGLYRSLSNLATGGSLDSQGFYWLPDLAGPTTIAARQAGDGISWLWPLVDGAPAIGWEAAQPYLYLPVALVVFQWLSSQVLSPLDPNDDNAAFQGVLLTLLPLLLGFFSLQVPSGVSLYYCSNIVLTTVLQFYLKKLGGAEVTVNDLGPVRKLGMGRREGEVLTQEQLVSLYAGLVDDYVAINPLTGLPEGEEAPNPEELKAQQQDAENQAFQGITKISDVDVGIRRCKRESAAVKNRATRGEGAVVEEGARGAGEEQEQGLKENGSKGNGSKEEGMVQAVGVSDAA